MKLHRYIGVTQTTACFMLQRIREGLIPNMGAFKGPAKVDEAYFGGPEKNKHNSKKTGLGRGPAGKTAVVGTKARTTGQTKAKLVECTDKDTLGGFIDDNAIQGAQLYTVSATAYKNINRPHEAAKHFGSECVNGQAHVNGVGLFWAVLKRSYHGVYYHVSKKHLNRYVTQLAGRHKLRGLDTETQMQHNVAGMVGCKVLDKELIASPKIAIGYAG